MALSELAKLVMAPESPISTDIFDVQEKWMTQEKKLEAVLRPRMRSRQGGSWLNQGEESREQGSGLK